MAKIGLEMAISKTANTIEEAREIATNLIGGFPIIIRPAFTLGGTGGGIAYNQDEFEAIVKGGLKASMTSQVSTGSAVVHCHAPQHGVCATLVRATSLGRAAAPSRPCRS